MSKFSISKKQKKNNIMYYWWVYVVFTLICVVVSYTVFNLKDRIKDSERIEIFVSSQIVDYSIEEQLEEKYRDSGILDICFTQIEPSSNLYNQSLEINGFENSDILFIPESQLVSHNIYKCLLFDDTLTGTYQSHSFFYDEENDVYGIQIFDINDGSFNDTYKANKHFNFKDENYFIVINKKSKHIGEYGVSSYDDIALKVFNDLLE